MYVLAIDSGGTKIIGTVVDENGTTFDKQRITNTGRNGRFLIATCCDLIKKYRQKYDISAIGLGCNGRIDVERGIVLDAVYEGYNGLDVRGALESFSDLPVSVNNDCYCGIYGEIWKGAAQNYRSVVGLVIGTGLGGAIYANGRFLHGGHFGAGEIGHMILYRDGVPCFCGQHGCVERYVSGTGLWKRYNERSATNMISSGYEFFERLHAGDADAKAVLELFADDLSLVMVNVANLANPDVFLIGGGIADTRGDWSDLLAASYKALAGPFLKDTPIVYAKMGNDAALLGAAKFAFDHYKSLEK